MNSSRILEEIKRQRDENILDHIKPKFLSKEERVRLSNGQKTRSMEISMDRPTQKTEYELISAPELTETERTIIKRQYLGAEKTGRRSRRGDRQVNFDWDERDDTTLPDTRVAVGRTANRTVVSTVKTVDSLGNEVELMVTNAKTGTKRHFDDRHWSKKRVDEMQERDWRILREDFSISISGGHLPPPIRFWYEAPFPSRLGRIVADIGYEEPTPIQRQTIPLIMEGRDVIGIAETGSGKTAAFILPMVCQMLKLPTLNEENMLDGPYGLVLAPTRELALQIENEARKFCRPLGLRCVSIVGGHSLAEQSVHMRKGAEIVIATPGRLRDCLEQHVLALCQCICLVLDEADRMIDLNFEEDLRFILSCLPSTLEGPNATGVGDPQCLLRGKFRQTTMFSATMPPSVERLARAYLRYPAMVTVGMAGQAADTVEQRVILLNDEDKDRRLLETLDSGEFPFPIIIFVNQKRAVDFLYHRLNTLGYRCIALHGGKNQEQREIAISSIRNRQRDILIATDVAGRGLDIPEVSLVVNYDMAKSIDDYIHRIGRTGRMGKSGVAITFLTMNDAELFYELRIILQKASRSIIPPEFLAHEASRIKPGTILQRKRYDEKIFAYGV